MNPERHQRLKALFDAAADRPAAERPAFLAAAAPDEPTLRAEVAELLAWDAAHPDFLNAPARTAARDFLNDATATGRPDDGGGENAAAWTPAGRRLGAWELREILGRGGMGTVFLALRADGEFHQRAALKLVAGGGWADAENRRRFRVEREVLASLEHPHIARLLDGGVTPEGALFYVMELVENGVPITAFCRAHGADLGAAGRVALFQKVCAAVQYAHGRLVVHRDLKPANLLVTPAGEPKLLDFGIAKLLRPGDDGPDVTVTADRPLTPAYASPEQLRGDAPSSVADDVYSLGVMLYETLAGRHPFRAPGETLTAAQLAARVCESDPAPPSKAEGGRRKAEGRVEEGDTTSGFSAFRLPPSAFRLPTSLDAVVLKAMHRERARRYPTVQALADDLQRFAQGRPVHARPDRWGYRAGLFVRRHPVGVAAGVLFGFTVLGGGLVFARQARETRLQRDLAVETATVMATDLVKGLEKLSGPLETRQALLQKAADTLARIGAANPGDPEVERRQIEAARQLVAGYEYLGDLPAARRHADETVARAERLIQRRGEAATLADRLVLSQTHKSLCYVARKQSDPALAAAAARAAVNVLMTQVGSDPRLPTEPEARYLLGELYPLQGQCYRDLGRLDIAAGWFQGGVGVIQGTPGWQDRPEALGHVAACESGLAAIAGERGRPEKRYEHQERAAKLWRRVRESQPDAPIVTLNFVSETGAAAQAALAAGRPVGEALALHAEAVAAIRALVARDPSAVLPRSVLLAQLSDQGVTCLVAGDVAGAALFLEESVALGRRLQQEGKASPNMEGFIGVAATRLGEARLRRGDLPGAAESLDLARGLLDRFAAARPADPVPRRKRARALELTAALRLAQNDAPGALAPASEALVLRRADGAVAEPGGLAGALFVHARALHGTGDADGARRGLAEARRLHADSRPRTTLEAEFGEAGF